MSRKGSAAPRGADEQQETAGELLGAFTMKAVEQVRDAATRKTLSELFRMTSGLAAIITSSNPQDRAVASVLSEVNFGRADVKQMVKLGMGLIAQCADRDAKDALHTASVDQCEASRVKTHGATVSFANLARAKLGQQSPVLERFGIKIIGGRKGSKRIKKTKETFPTAPSGSTRA